MITIAVSKGRMQDDAIALLAKAGVRLSAESLASRKLALEDESGEYRFIFVKPADVPVYVEHGIADCGIVGRMFARIRSGCASSTRPGNCPLSPCCCGDRPAVLRERLACCELRPSIHA